ncbi:MAG: hypothetical protein ABIN96_11220 [Rubrivivax sp.]
MAWVMAAVLGALVFVACLRNQVRTLLETTKLLKDVQREQDLADRAEAPRIEGVSHFIADELRQLEERSGVPRFQAFVEPASFRPVAIR